MHPYKRSRRDAGPLVYVIIGLVIGLFVMGVMWSVFGAEIPGEDTEGEVQTTQDTTSSIITPVAETVTSIDVSATNCKMLEEFRDAVNAEVDTGALPALSKPYRKVSVEKAKSTAIAWASDAVWTGFTVSYPAEGAGFLTYTYYSASKAKSVSIMFGAGGTSVNNPTTGDLEKSFAATDVINANLWQITLADAWTTAYAQVRPSCASWWKTTTALAWTSTLRMHDTTLLWEFNFFDMTSPETTKRTIVVDATTGKITSKSWSEESETTPTTAATGV